MIKNKIVSKAQRAIKCRNLRFENVPALPELILSLLRVLSRRLQVRVQELKPNLYNRSIKQLLNISRKNVLQIFVILVLLWPNLSAVG